MKIDKNQLDQENIAKIDCKDQYFMLIMNNGTLNKNDLCEELSYTIFFSSFCVR